MKNELSLTLLVLLIVAILIMPLSSCKKDTYTAGVVYPPELDIYLPDDNDFVVFQYAAHPDLAFDEFVFGSGQTQQEVLEMITQYYRAEGIDTYLSRGYLTAACLSTVSAAGNLVEYTVYPSQGKLNKYYQSIAEVKIGATGGAIIPEESLSIMQALTSGVLQYYPTDSQHYNEVRLQALDKIDSLSDELVHLILESADKNMLLIEQMQQLFAGQTRNWLAQDFFNQARIDYLRASLYVDKYYNLSVMPVELKQSFRPLCALQAADNLIQSVVWLLTAGNLLSIYGDISAEEQQIIDNSFTAWSENWQITASTASTAISLAQLIEITTEIDCDVAQDELNTARNSLEELNEILDEYSASTINSETIEQAELLMQTYNEWISVFNSSRLAQLSSLSLSDNNLLTSGNQSINYRQQTDKLKMAISNASAKSSQSNPVGYTTKYNTELAEGVIQVFLKMKIPEASIDDDQPTAPIIMDAISSGNFEYDMLIMGALQAAERRNKNTSTNTQKLPQVSGFTGDNDLDDLLTILADQVNRKGNSNIEQKSSTVANIDIAPDLPDRIRHASNNLGSDPQTSKHLADNQQESDFNKLDLVSDFLTMLDTGNSTPQQTGTAKNILKGSLKTQIQTGVMAVSQDQKTPVDSIDSLTDFLKSSSLVKELKMRLIAQSIGDQIDMIISEFSENPQQALNKALVRLRTQLGDSQEYADWTALLSGMQEAANNNEFWNKLAEALTGDVDALLGHVFDTFIADSNEGQAMLNNLVNETETITEAPTESSQTISSHREPSDDVNLSGYYKLELSLLTFDYTVKPYNPNNRLGKPEGVVFENDQVEDYSEDVYGEQGNKTAVSEQEWQELVLKEQEDIKQEENFRLIETTIEIWHNPETNQLSASLSKLLSLGVAYQEDYTPKPNNDNGYKTIYFEQSEENMAHGYISFVPWGEGENEIEGVLTVYFDGMLNYLEREFRVNGYQISD